MSNQQRILDFIRAYPGLDDDEISRRTGIQPRQQVNQICRQLAAAGLIERRRVESDKVRNYPTGATPRVQSEPRPTPSPAVPTAPSSSRVEPSTVSEGEAGAAMRDTLFLIPCSGRKLEGGRVRSGSGSLVDQLSPSTASQLRQARARVLAAASLDDRLVMPAWQRYAGTFYQAARATLASAVEAGLHVLIISGGYGVVAATDEIGTYERRLKRNDWQPDLLERVLLEYVRAHSLRRVRAFVAATTDYGKLVRTTDWCHSPCRDVEILSPVAGGGAMVTVPRALGEAFAAHFQGKLTPDWRSSDGLRLRTMKVTCE